MEAEFGYCSPPPPPPPPPPSQFTTTTAAADHFIVEDLLDFSNDDGHGLVVHDSAFDNLTGNSISTTDSSTLTPVDSCNSSFSVNNDPILTPAGVISGRGFSDTHFSGDLCVPYEDLAELEWLSNFVEESFSSEDLQKLQLISGMSAMKTRPDKPDPTRPTNPASATGSPIFGPEMPVPGKARSKRSRAAPCNWTSRLMVVSPTTTTTATTANNHHHHPPAKSASHPRKTLGGGGGGGGSGPDTVASGGGGGGEAVRRCLHCATDKTPQWRTGPMGPKTLCNACGVRYKSGRLVPEYRPAASPTFVLTKHSNSHRKVMELRRQKEMMMMDQPQHHQQLINHPNGMGFDPSNSEDYLIHQNVGPDFRQLL